MKKSTEEGILGKVATVKNNNFTHRRRTVPLFDTELLNKDELFYGKGVRFLNVYTAFLSLPYWEKTHKRGFYFYSHQKGNMRRRIFLPCGIIPAYKIGVKTTRLKAQILLVFLRRARIFLP